MFKSDRDGRLVGLFIRKIDERNRNAKLKTRRSDLFATRGLWHEAGGDAMTIYVYLTGGP